MFWFNNLFKKIKAKLIKPEEKNKGSDKSIAENVNSASGDAGISIETTAQYIASIAEDYQNALSELKKQALKATEEIDKAKKEFKKINDDVGDTKRLVVLGFWLILIMVVGVFIGYWINSINNTNLLETVNDNINSVVDKQNQRIYEYNTEINNLNNRLDNFKILNPYLK